MSRIQVQNLIKEYSTPEGPLLAVNDVSFEVDDGEFVCLVGPSGCGKTTLLRCIAGLETPTDGNISADDEAITELPPQNRELAFVFQDIALYPHMKVWQNISYPLKLQGMSSDERYEEARQAAETTHIDELLDKYPGELSGGQQQRVALSRAIVRSPRAYLLDEPMSDLDAKLKKEMRVELQRIQKEVDGTMLYVTHDQEEAMTLSDRMLVMDDGKIQQYGSPLTVYHEPANVFVAQFIGSPEMNLVQSTCTGSTGEEVSIDETSWTVRTGIEASVPDDVILGFRPQHTDIHHDETEGIRGEVLLVETVGDDGIVYIETEIGEVRAVVDVESVAVSEGDTVSVDVNRSYLFEADTGELIAHDSSLGSDQTEEIREAA